MPRWKRALAVVGLVIASIWLAAMGLQTIRVRCKPRTDGTAQCVHAVRYAGITRSTTEFTPTPTTVSSHSHGKGNMQGTVDIQTPTGEVEITWLTSNEAKRVAQQLVSDPEFSLDSGGPRWWLLFLLLTIPVTVSLVAPSRVRTQQPPVATLASPQTRKARRAEEGRARKAAASGKRTR